MSFVLERPDTQPLSLYPSLEEPQEVRSTPQATRPLSPRVSPSRPPARVSLESSLSRRSWDVSLLQRFGAGYFKWRHRVANLDLLTVRWVVQKYPLLRSYLSVVVWGRVSQVLSEQRKKTCQKCPQQMTYSNGFMECKANQCGCGQRKKAHLHVKLTYQGFKCPLGKFDVGPRVSKIKGWFARLQRSR